MLKSIDVEVKDRNKQNEEFSVKVTTPVPRDYVHVTEDKEGRQVTKQAKELCSAVLAEGLLLRVRSAA
jgi:hypothetical protein